MDKFEVASNTLIDILESTVFIFAEPMNRKFDIDMGGWEPIGSELSYYGRVSGKLYLFASRSFLAVIAETLLGFDRHSDEAKDMGKGVLKEILNIVVGNFISKYYGTKEVFELGLPTILDDDRNYNDIVYSKDSIWFRTEDGNILLVLNEDSKE